MLNKEEYMNQNYKEHVRNRVYELEQKKLLEKAIDFYAMFYIKSREQLRMTDIRMGLTPDSYTIEDVIRYMTNDSILSDMKITEDDKRTHEYHSFKNIIIVRKQFISRMANNQVITFDQISNREYEIRFKKMFIKCSILIFLIFIFIVAMLANFA